MCHLVDNDVDAGWITGFLATGNSTVIKSEGEVMVDKLREDGEKLVCPVGGCIHVSAVDITD